jgi:hypothetical protein
MAADAAPGFDSRRYQMFCEVVVLERCPLNFVSTIELLKIKNSGICLEIRDYGRRGPSRWSRGTFYQQKLALTLSPSGGRSVGIVRLRTHATSFIIPGRVYQSVAMAER